MQRTTWSVKTLRILILDDDSMIGLLLGDLLEAMGHEVCAIVETETGAVNAAKSCQPDLIIADSELKEGSGIGAVERICMTKQIPHLFMSGDISNVKMKWPDAVFVQKPFLEDDLATAILRALHPAAGAFDQADDAAA